ncbi:hypothetical protein K2W90_05910 [Candidatus Babeliales bacterium]|nr:hypothetical protein [Candidatus Babeliales bacterium]
MKVYSPKIFFLFFFLLIENNVVYGMPPAADAAGGTDDSAEQATEASSTEDSETTDTTAPSNQESEEKSSTESSGNDEESGGPETVELPADSVGLQGNWLKKKDWLIRAHEVNTQVRQLLLEIQGARKSFNEKYNVIDNELDTFYRSISTDQGKLNELFASLEKYLKKKKKQELAKFEETKGEERVKERYSLIKIQLLEEDITRQKKQLKQLKLDMQSIEDLDKSITQRLKKVDDEIKNSIEIASQTRKMMEDLWTFIDHKKAEAHYYKIKNDIFERLNTIKNYLNTQLLQDFDKVSNAIRTQMQKTKNAIEELEKEGFIVKDRTSRIEKIKVDELLAVKMAQEKEAASTKKERTKRKPKSTWYGRAYDWFVAKSARFYYMITHPIETLFGTSEKSDEKKTEESTLRPSTSSGRAGQSKQKPTDQASKKEPVSPSVRPEPVEGSERKEQAPDLETTTTDIPEESETTAGSSSEDAQTEPDSSEPATEDSSEEPAGMGMPSAS